MPPACADDGPVCVTGAAGYIGSHVVRNLVEHGYTVRACVREGGDSSKQEMLSAMNLAGHQGRVELFTADLGTAGAFDDAFRDCTAVFHVAALMPFTGQSGQSVYDSNVTATLSILDSVRKSGTVRRVLYTSSFAAVGHPSDPDLVTRFSEENWADEDPECWERLWGVPWAKESFEKNLYIAYAMAKCEAERLVARTAAQDGTYDAISFNPAHVIGPLLCKAHLNPGSYQATIGKIVSGADFGRKAQYNFVDVRDVADAQRLALESENCQSGSRYLLTSPDTSGELTGPQLESSLQRIFPGIAIQTSDEPYVYMYPGTGPLAFCTRACEELGLVPHPIDEALRDTVDSLISVGAVQLSEASNL